MSGSGGPGRRPAGRVPEDRGEGPWERERPGEGYRVRAMEEGDLPRVARVERASFSVPWSRQAFGKLMGRREVLCRVVEREGPGDPQVVGHAILWCLADEAELANIAVAPEERGRGLGGLLLDAVLEEVRDWRVRRVFLEVRRSDDRAQRLYRSRGFRHLGIRRDYYRRPREDALVMARAVAPGRSTLDAEEP